MAVSLAKSPFKRLVEELTVQMARRRRIANGDGLDDDGDESRVEDELKHTLIALASLVGDNLFEKALALSARKDAVEEIRAECGRAAFSVKGETNVYRVLASGYCSCPVFANARGSAGMCKHILAVLLAQAQGTVRAQKVSDKEWAMKAWKVSIT